MTKTAVPEELRDRTDYLLCKIADTVRRDSDDAFSAHGIRSAHYALLRSLAAAGPLPQQQLARRLSIDPSTVVDLLDQLAARGSVTRTRSTQDRRVSLVELTADGRRLLEDAESTAGRIRQALADRLGAREFQRLHAALLTLVDGA